MRQTRDRRAVLRRFKELGVDVEPVARTGELSVTHPALGMKRVKWNRRRQDMPRQVVRALEKIEKSLTTPTPS